jgi:SAM-dependent methyltransferase
MGADDGQQIASVSQVQTAPIPPRELIERTGGRQDRQRGQSDEWFRELYLRSGRERKAGITEVLPADWSFEGKRVLDFGCGAGRVLHAFLPEAASGEFWGCDLHRPTIALLDQHLSLPLRFYVNDRIPTRHPDGYFDLVYAISVFTHITHEWSAWLLELHRILKPGGLLLATFCGPGFWWWSLSEPPDENELGMCVQRLGQRLEETSGPVVLHSPWWLRAHWGRAFEILSLGSSGFAGHDRGHGFVLGQKRDVSLARDDLERPDAEDPRELAAQRRQLLVLEQGAMKMGERWERERVANAKLSETLERQRSRAREQRKLLRGMLGSRAFGIAEQLSRLHRRGRPVFSREQIRRALGDEDGSA